MQERNKGTVVLLRQNSSDSVSRINDSTPVMLRNDGDSTRLESRFYRMTRVRAILTNSLNIWLTNPVCLHTNKLAFLASVMIISANLLFCLCLLVVLCYILRIKWSTNTEVEVRFCFSLSGQQWKRHLNSLSWFKVAFAYYDRWSWQSASFFYFRSIPEMNGVCFLHPNQKLNLKMQSKSEKQILLKLKACHWH